MPISYESSPLGVAVAIFMALHTLSNVSMLLLQIFQLIKFLFSRPLVEEMLERLQGVSYEKALYLIKWKNVVEFWE